jgi:predicted ATPase
MQILQQVEAHNFASFADLTIRFSDLTVLVGPNGAGKSNLLKLFRFLGETARTDLAPAVSAYGGFEQILFRGKHSDLKIRIALLARITKYASVAAPDEYSLEFWVPGWASRSKLYVIARTETFLFKRTKGKGRRITLSGTEVSVQQESGQVTRPVKVQASSSGLSILRRLSKELDAPQVDELAGLFETLRVFDVNVVAARQPFSISAANRLEADASNLASYLSYLHDKYPLLFERIVDDMRQVLPGLNDIQIQLVGGAVEGRIVLLHEQGISVPTPLALASYGTVRALALFTMLSDPAPPKLTCIEEIDHGLHPYALDRLVDRLRTAARDTQIIVATHSPALVNRLDPSELVVFERDPETGGTRSPNVPAETIKEMAAESAYGLGELWFSGVLGGVPSS